MTSCSTFEAWPKHGCWYPTVAARCSSRQARHCATRSQQPWPLSSHRSATRGGKRARSMFQGPLVASNGPISPMAPLAYRSLAVRMVINPYRYEGVSERQSSAIPETARHLRQEERDAHRPVHLPEQSDRCRARSIHGRGSDPAGCRARHRGDGRDPRPWAQRWSTARHDEADGGAAWESSTGSRGVTAWAGADRDSDVGERASRMAMPLLPVRM